jgi:preprotein translocase subunit SecD
LPDRDGKFCYVLGPVAVTGASIESAGAQYDSTQSEWVATVHFGNDDFLDKVAKPDIGRQIAIEIDGVVESAPVVEQGIVGRDVQISGQFTKQEAQDLALVLRYGALPVQLRFVSATRTR